MTSIPRTDLTTEAARNRATRMLNEQDAALMVALADAYETAQTAAHEVTLSSAIRTAKSVADRDKYSPQESAAAWDVVDALQTLRTTGETIEAAPDEDDRDGKQITRAEEVVPGANEDWPDNV